MRKLLLLLALCGVCSAQSIPPYQIYPSPTNGQVLTTVGGVTSWANFNVFTSQSASTFFVGPCGGAASIPTFRVFCSADFAAALTADPTLTISSATINNTGTITTGNIFSAGVLSYATDCAGGTQAFALGFISNGTFTGPTIAPVITPGICPSQSSFTIAPWATDSLSIQEAVECSSRTVEQNLRV
jgi:hypothetical protein